MLDLCCYVIFCSVYANAGKTDFPTGGNKVYWIELNLISIDSRGAAEAFGCGGGCSMCWCAERAKCLQQALLQVIFVALITL